jgi:hypothetical protein
MSTGMAGMTQPKAAVVFLATLLIAFLLPASGVFAKPSVLELRAKHVPLKAGDAAEFEANQGVILETASGSVNCPTVDDRNGLLGADVTNGAKKDQIDITEALGTFDGGSCSASITGFGTFAEFFFVGSGATLGTLTLDANLTAEFKAARTTYVRLNFPETDAKCAYKVGTLHGALKPGLPINVTFTKQKLKLGAKKEDSPLCPASTELSAKFFKAFHPEGGSMFSDLEALVV